MKEMTHGQKGDKNGNMALQERFTQALLGQSVLPDIAEGWDDENDFRDHPDRRMPAFRMIMMKRNPASVVTSTALPIRGAKSIRTCELGSQKIFRIWHLHRKFLTKITPFLSICC